MNAIKAFGGVVSLRHTGPIVGGFIAGPWVGLVAGLIGGAYRAMTGGVTMHSAVAACVLSGLCAGLYAKFFRKDRMPGVWEAAIFVAVFECFAGGLTVFSVGNLKQAWHIEQGIRIPLIIGNAIGVALFLAAVKTLAKERDLRKAKEQIENELNVARSIQMSMVPKMLPSIPTWPECDLHASLHSAREVGGDFYDFFIDGAGRLVFSIGDVSDKGVPAALLMAVTKTLMKGLHQPGLMPSDLLERVNRDIAEANDAIMFITVFCGVLDFTTGELWFSNAGHNPPILVRGEKSADWMKLPKGFVLGPDGGSKYLTDKIVMEPNDMLVTYTDGVTEAMSPERHLFSDQKLLDTVRSATAASPEGMVKLIAGAVAAHAATAPQSDDITILALKRR